MEKENNVENILENIKNYNFTQENIENFIFENIGDASSFYFRSMLLSLLKNREHLEIIAMWYYKLEQGQRFANTVRIKENGRTIEKREIDILNESYAKMEQLLKDFERGDFSELKKIISWAEKISDQIKLEELKIPQKETMSLFEELEDLETLKIGKNRTLKTNLQIIEHKKQKIKQNENMLISKSSIIEKIRNWRTSRKIKKDVRQLEEEIQRLCEENLELTNQIKQCDLDIEETLRKIEKLYTSYGAEELGKTICERYRYYDGTVPIEMFYNTGRKPIYKEKSLNYLPEVLEYFKEDLYVSSKFIQNLSSILSVLQETKDLEQVCYSIRKALSDTHAKTERGIELQIRKNDLERDGQFWSQVPTAEEVPAEYEKLSTRFREILMESDEHEFIKKCADFHFDFIKAHPYSDGNGRTSRILLTIMLASHNIIFPSLYNSPQGKENFYVNSNKALNGDYTEIENAIFKRLGHFYPGTTLVEQRNNEEVR